MDTEALRRLAAGIWAQLDAIAYWQVVTATLVVAPALYLAAHRWNARVACALGVVAPATWAVWGGAWGAGAALLTWGVALAPWWPAQNEVDDDVAARERRRRRSAR